MTAHRLLLTCMKNEGPFILEWVAYHVAIGFDHFLVYTNDCEDGTDEIWQRLAQMGLATHRNNPANRASRASHQIRAFRKAVTEEVYKTSEWCAVMDVDEFLNVHVGDKSLQALLDALPEAECISLMWRLFGSSDRTHFHDSFIASGMRRAAPRYCPKPIHAWGMKSLFRPQAIEFIGPHRPKSVPGAWEDLKWVNAAGAPMPERYFDSNWRMDKETAAYDFAQINHYAVRSRQSFLIKCLRGRAHHDYGYDAEYWERMNRNDQRDETIQPLMPATHAAFEELLEDPILGDLHGEAVEWHQETIAKTLETSQGQAMMAAILPKMFGSAA